MIIEISNHKLDVDLDKTKEFYTTAPLVSESCSCNGCHNFEKAVDALPTEVIDFFSQLGIDMKKMCEVYASHENADGTLSYGGFTHICGKIIEGDSAWVEASPNSSYWESEKAIHITNNFQVTFKEECYLLEDNFPRPSFQLELQADIPWVLPEEHDYYKCMSTEKKQCITNNVYCFESAKIAKVFLLPKEGVLIDCGLPWEVRGIHKEMKNIRYNPKNLKHILITHSDFDHVGGLTKLLFASPNATVWIGRDDVQYLASEKKRPSLKGWILDLFKPNLPADYRVLEDWKHSKIEAINTPGHSEGHHAFKYDSCLFIGDIYKNINGKLKSAKKNEDREVLAKTREFIKTIGCNLIIPSHGDIIDKEILP